MKRMFFRVAAIMLVSLSSVAFSAPVSIKFFQTDSRYDYHVDLLRLAMEKTSGPYVLEPVKNRMTQKRGLAFLTAGKKVDIAFLAANKEREAAFLPVRVPLLQGLLGHRVFIIRKDKLESFSKIKTLEQLKTGYKAGFGSQWADMEILESNQLPVYGTVNYENLFKMLSAGRFDYFPRGINEAWREVEERKDRYPDLVVEPKTGIYYDYPVYYFVNKKNVSLAKRVEAGLKKALSDGTFKALFMKYHRSLIRRADLKNRRLFELKNRTLSPDVPKMEKGWWFE
ncbi:conserved exported hypothetical protein [Candidatus Desulfarcum epimagneticum]|uniref:Uncharacterized protein n=1 Tax=uncultured Desulfobacteraceae bacterium TaxID=218296 RepID=A0A484HCK2_9BACT|nr:conserved exported hypothetical protein [uncultured Desulfobacteraceae bacterium]